MAIRCYIGIGSNLGDRQKNMDIAIQRLRETDAIEVNKASSIYETEPAGGPEQPRYLNGVLEIETDLAAIELLSVLQDIENQLGRERIVKNGPRTIDLDILTYGDHEINEPGLKVPHPRMTEREFVQRPLRELIKDKPRTSRGVYSEQGRGSPVRGKG
ncbi:MAG: 2-amino-4-hydroxy-6-hydroxymethyldihydropteridine diphosphokinase [Candidatus Omnitrophica bacterium]|nr:2-amino-4-hydroxy-6-hydroxymethyldihydropteridine diphosphokinase [Candidatus Omnitrophota bacterium]